MDYKSVIEEQIRELQKVQDNISIEDPRSKIVTAQAIAELCEKVLKNYGA